MHSESDLESRVIRVCVALENEPSSIVAPVLLEPAFQDPGIYLMIKDCKATSKIQVRRPRAPNTFLIFSYDNRPLFRRQFRSETNFIITKRLAIAWLNLPNHIKENYLRITDKVLELYYVVHPQAKRCVPKGGSRGGARDRPRSRDGFASTPSEREIIEAEAKTRLGKENAPTDVHSSLEARKEEALKPRPFFRPTTRWNGSLFGLDMSSDSASSDSASGPQAYFFGGAPNFGAGCAKGSLSSSLASATAPSTSIATPKVDTVIENDVDANQYASPSSADQPLPLHPVRPASDSKVKSLLEISYNDDNQDKASLQIVEDPIEAAGRGDPRQHQQQHLQQRHSSPQQQQHHQHQQSFDAEAGSSFAAPSPLSMASSVNRRYSSCSSPSNPSSSSASNWVSSAASLAALDALTTLSDVTIGKIVAAKEFPLEQILTKGSAANKLLCSILYDVVKDIGKICADLGFVSAKEGSAKDVFYALLEKFIKENFPNLMTTDLMFYEGSNRMSAIAYIRSKTRVMFFMRMKALAKKFDNNGGGGVNPSLFM